MAIKKKKNPTIILNLIISYLINQISIKYQNHSDYSEIDCENTVQYTSAKHYFVYMYENHNAKLSTVVDCIYGFPFHVGEILNVVELNDQIALISD